MSLPKTQEGQWPRIEVERDWDGIVLLKVESAPDSEPRHCAIDTKSFEVWCDCPDSQMRRDPQARRAGVTPSLFDEKSCCKHVRASAKLLVVIGWLQLPTHPNLAYLGVDGAGG